MNLSNLKTGESAKILNICCVGNTRKRLLYMGFTPDTIVTVKYSAPFNDPLYISLRNYSISIRKADANKILIERI